MIYIYDDWEDFVGFYDIDRQFLFYLQKDSERYHRLLLSKEDISPNVYPEYRVKQIDIEFFKFQNSMTKKVRYFTDEDFEHFARVIVPLGKKHAYSFIYNGLFFSVAPEERAGIWCQFTDVFKTIADYKQFREGLIQPQYIRYDSTIFIETESFKDNINNLQGKVNFIAENKQIMLDTYKEFIFPTVKKVQELFYKPVTFFDGSFPYELLNNNYIDDIGFGGTYFYMLGPTESIEFNLHIDKCARMDIDFIYPKGMEMPKIFDFRNLKGRAKAQISLVEAVITCNATSYEINKITPWFYLKKKTFETKFDKDRTDWVDFATCDNDMDKVKKLLVHRELLGLHTVGMPFFVLF